jgi:hypothetical protein
MTTKFPAHTPHFIEALQWASELHCQQCRKGKDVPYISHLIAVSALVWEDGGDEEQAIAGLLHDAIVDAGVSSAQIAERYGERVARIVEDCTDTNGPVTAVGQKEPWLVCKRRYVEHLLDVPLDSLLVSAADKAHNARDQMLDARRDSSSWSRFNAGIEGTACYQLRIPNPETKAAVQPFHRTAGGGPAGAARQPGLPAGGARGDRAGGLGRGLSRAVLKPVHHPPHVHRRVVKVPIADGVLEVGVVERHHPGRQGIGHLLPRHPGSVGIVTTGHQGGQRSHKKLPQEVFYGLCSIQIPHSIRPTTGFQGWPMIHCVEIQ